MGDSSVRWVCPLDSPFEFAGGSVFENCRQKIVAIWYLSMSCRSLKVMMGWLGYVSGSFQDIVPRVCHKSPGF